MIEISQEFGFDAAHYLGNGAAENRRLHGHSFYAEVTLRGQANPATGFLRDFGEVNAALQAIREELDHRLLNDIEGLGVPTLENLARFIYARAKTALPEVARVKLRRPSYGQLRTHRRSLRRYSKRFRFALAPVARQHSEVRGRHREDEPPQQDLQDAY